MWPSLSIVITTYNRKDVLEETLGRLEQHLGYNGERSIIIADDGSSDGTHEMLKDKFPSAGLVITERGGLGANTNNGLRIAFSQSDYVLQLQDDMHLLKHLDLHPHIETLRDNPTCGFIRLWGIAGHRYQAQLEGAYWRVWWHSPELYIPSDRPHLKHWRFHKHFGFYPEGLATANTEEAFCHQCKDRAGSQGEKVDVFIPHSIDTETSWEHAGWGMRWRDQGL